MNHTAEQQDVRERFVIALIEATYPLKQETVDPEVTQELLIEAADLLREHLQAELAELRQEQSD